jgi:hypothetical protein
MPRWQKERCSLHIPQPHPNIVLFNSYQGLPSIVAGGKARLENTNKVLDYFVRDGAE